jgi:hypothetical protein
MDIDRRILWLIYGLALAYPLIFPIGLPISIDDTTAETFNVIDNLEPGSRIAFHARVGGVTLPELYPIAKAIIQHLWEIEDVKLIFLTFGVDSPVWQDKIMSEIDMRGREYGVDYVYLGYTPGGLTAQTMMADDLPSLVSVDYYGTPFNELPNNGAIMKDIKTAADFDILIDIEGSGYENFLGPWQAKYGTPTILGVQAVNIPGTIVYWEAGQIIGYIKGARGAAEYENLIGKPGDAVAGMDAQSLAHITVMILIILGNINYFLSERKGTRLEVTT